MRCVFVVVLLLFGRLRDGAERDPRTPVRFRAAEMVFSTIAQGCYAQSANTALPVRC